MSAGAAALGVVLERGEDFEALKQTAQLKATCKTVLEVCVHRASQKFRNVLAAAWRRRQEAQAQSAAASIPPHRCILPLWDADIWNAL